VEEALDFRKDLNVMEMLEHERVVRHQQEFVQSERKKLLQL